MGLNLLREYVAERYGHEVTEVPNGFAVYGLQQLDGRNILFVQDFYVSPANRGHNNSSARQLFNKLKGIVKQEGWEGIAGMVQLDALNGNKMLKLFLGLGFKAIRGDNTSILIYYEVKNGHEKR
tara:strand:- start:1437 stop:1808 length:372 start_codon:yes stop_codon:yes gene_type:complete